MLYVYFSIWCISTFTDMLISVLYPHYKLAVFGYTIVSIDITIPIYCRYYIIHCLLHFTGYLLQLKFT
ncbi:hypothetical protein BDB01DRAFT_797889 [Pilobolus umbonatus]|nr:hypothetical protein BDB01DRAFT_797889 [Pilobolus umbonatus]